MKKVETLQAPGIAPDRKQKGYTMSVGPVNYNTLIYEAQSLKSEDGENPEYDRALVELISCATGVDFAEVLRAINPPTPAKVIDRLTTELYNMVDMLSEAHSGEIADGHGGDDPATCSYCRAIRGAKEALDFAADLKMD